MLIGAGSDTTSTVLQNFFKIMALHPHVVASAQKGSQRPLGNIELSLAYRVQSSTQSLADLDCPHGQMK